MPKSSNFHWLDSNHMYLYQWTYSSLFSLIHNKVGGFNRYTTQMHYIDICTNNLNQLGHPSKYVFVGLL
jgi:hypothetical protein